MSKKKISPALATLVGEGCITCQFYLLANGLCRRNPPQIIASKTERKNGDTVVTEWQSVFPSMLPEGWCGEHRQRKVN